MKKSIILALSLLYVVNTYSQSNCDNAFNAANYSVAHTNKAYESNNTAHVQEWSAKAIETFQEVEQITIDCGCNLASSLAYEGYVAADKCLDQNTWERSRFYAKRAKEKARLMMDALSKCTNTSIEKIQDNNYDTASLSNDIANDLALQQQELIDQQNELVAKQRELENQLAEQKKRQQLLKLERDAELKKQHIVQNEAEITLAQLQATYEKLATTLGCKQAYNSAKSNFKRSLNSLQNENLSDTKLFYATKLNEISENAMNHFLECAEQL